MNITAATSNYIEAKEIIDRHGLTCWLTGGTALGAFRDNSLIPHDHDIDFRVLPTEWDTKTMEKDLTDAGFRYVDSIEPGLYGNNPSGAVVFKRGIRMDFDLLYYYPPKRFVCSLSHTPYDRCVHTVEFYEGNHFIDFLGSKVRIPYPTEEFLEFLYGADWRIPDTDSLNMAKWYKKYKSRSMGEFVKYFHEHPKLDQLGSKRAWK